jgi:hypothetical protein
MKLVVTIFFLLCCFLPARHCYANKNSQHLTSCLCRYQIAEKVKFDPGVVNPQDVLAGNPGLNQENADLFYAEDEDDEYVPRKQLPGQLFADSRDLFPDSQNGLSDYLFVCKYLLHTNSCRYLTHRVLKI